MNSTVSRAALTAACISVAALAPVAEAVDRFEAPEAVIAHADGSFHFVWKFFKGPGSALLAGGGWLGTENVNGGLQGDCFCFPEACTIVEGDSIVVMVDGQLIDPERAGSVLNGISFCDVAGHQAPTSILPYSTTGVGDSPAGWALRLWNGPNPFSSRTTFHYVLPEPGHLTLRVHDLLGRILATVVDKVETAGRHSTPWIARGGPESELKAGVYFGRLTFGGRVQSTTLVVVP